jgi:hypothetical protein
MKPTTDQKVKGSFYEYSTESLLKKIKNIEQSGAFKFNGNKSADSKELANFLYKINFITAKKQDPVTKIVNRKYFEESRYLASKFVDYGFDWEVHPAYRWALQPDSLKNIFDHLALNID